MEPVEAPVPAARRNSAELNPASCSVDFEQTHSLMDSPPRPRNQTRRQRRPRQVSNPLLDTISAIEDDEDDDSSGGEKGDGYHSYMGGSSVDSGYKSCCPTPEMVDIAYYSTTLSPQLAAEQQKRLSVASQASQASQSSTASQPSCGGQKPRIAMGTKVMSRQTASATSVEPRRRHDSGFSDANVLQTAVPQTPPRPEKTDCVESARFVEASRLAEPARLVDKPRMPEPSQAPENPRTSEPQRVPDKDSLRPLMPSGSTHNPPSSEAVLRGTLTEEEVVQLVLRPRSSSVGSAVAGSPPSRRRGSPGPMPRCRPPPRPTVRHSSPHLPLGHRPQPRPTRHHSPSPGRPEHADLPPRRPAPQRVPPPKPARAAQRASVASVTAAPAGLSRTTREEDIDALVCGRTSSTDAAAAPDFRGDFTGAANIRWPASSASCLLPGRLQPPAGELAARPQPPKVGVKSKFSHMAQCMLDIIDELHGRGRTVTHRVTDPAAVTPPPAGSEYHTYEEVLYSALAERVREAAPSPEPPPLPLRPQQLFPSTGREVAATRLPSTGHAPKQRNNFYSLFKSVGERRHLSHNLRQEISADGDGDDYGFAVRK